MTRRWVMRAALAMVSSGLLLGLAACGDDDTETSAGQAPSTQAPSTQAPSATTAAPATAPTTAAAAAAVAMTMVKDPFGTIIVDAAGKALYTFDRDTTAVSTCVGGCATTWPPALLPAGASTPVPPQAGVTGTLTVSAHPGGGSQLVWNGKPLYRYAGDVNAGDVTGDGVGGTWHVAKL